MNKLKVILALMFLLPTARVAMAQEAVVPDSVIVMGMVVDHLTDEPQPYCRLLFLRGSDTAATMCCDEEGYFASNPLPVGTYTLNVTLRGQQVYQSDLVLGDNAALRIAVITDSFSFRILQPVEVIALKHMLGPLLVANKKDSRLWDFSYRGSPWELKRDGNAAVATPIALHPLYGDDPNTEGGGGCRSQGCVRLSKYYNQSFGLEVSPSNSAMKNELLREGRIHDTQRRASADTTQSH